MGQTWEKGPCVDGNQRGQTLWIRGLTDSHGFLFVSGYVSEARGILRGVKYAAFWVEACYGIDLSRPVPSGLPNVAGARWLSKTPVSVPHTWQWLRLVREMLSRVLRFCKSCSACEGQARPSSGPVGNALLSPSHIHAAIDRMPAPTQ
jgi:hypothetical protein